MLRKTAWNLRFLPGWLCLQTRLSLQEVKNPTYEIPTYEAIKGVLKSIYWKPTFEWIVDKVRVMNPIKMETRGVKLPKLTGKNDLAYYTYLMDVRYQVTAHFEWNMNRSEFEMDRNREKHYGIFAKSLLQRRTKRCLPWQARVYC